MTRTFESSPAVRRAVPLLIGLVGPSGGGKTYSALRLATGIQSVTGGRIFGIDTEAGRMLHYAPADGETADPSRGSFQFTHVPFDAPFSPADYLAAIEHAVSEGAKIIILDSMSHEHEGPGGVLEMHEAELDRMAKGDWKKRERMTFAAWIRPKKERQRLVNRIVQLGVTLIACFRAKSKMKPQKGGEPLNLGWQPIAGPEIVYEFTTCLLLPSAASGVPEFQPEHNAERIMLKVPRQFEWLYRRDMPLDEDAGKRMAEWAAGGTGGAPPSNGAPDLWGESRGMKGDVVYASARELATLRRLFREMNIDQKKALANASNRVGRPLERFADLVTEEAQELIELMEEAQEEAQ